MEKLINIIGKKVLVFDGATGTSLQNQNLTADDFGGKEFEGCNEYLVETNPNAVRKVHEDFLKAGCDLIETNSFGSTDLVLAEYNLEKLSYDLNFKSAKIAKEIANDFSTKLKPRFVAGSIGPTTKLPSLGHITFNEMLDSYFIQISGLIEGGADLLCVETCQDILQTKSALAAIEKYFLLKKIQLPVIASVTIETMGTMLMGTEISSAVTTLEPFSFISAIGINCATGPMEMEENVRYLSQNSSKEIFVMPNAGLPENIGGKAHYHLTPEEMKKWMTKFVFENGVSIIGGCCGTTAEHISVMAEIADEANKNFNLTRKINFSPSASSIYSSQTLKVEPAPLIIGERCNANGSKKFRDLLLAEDYDHIVQTAKEQEKEGSHILDLCVAYVGRDEKRDMIEVVKRLNTQISIPLMIDSTEVNVILAALENYSGRAIVNSINLEDGEKKAGQILELCKKHGAAVVALTIDEKGMAKTAESKYEIAKRIRTFAVEKYNLKDEDIIFDTLTFTLGSGEEEFRKSAIETIEAIKLIKKHFPKCYTSLGVSNISFGLNPEARHVLNSVFLHYSILGGLDMAIVHSSKIMPLYKIDSRAREVAEDLIFDRRKWSDDENRKIIYDPLIEFLALFKDKKNEAVKVKKVSNSIEETLKNRIIDGDKINLEEDLLIALKNYQALEIINKILLDGMKTVGVLFGSGQMQLPFVLQSAEVMKTAVKILEKFMDKTEISNKGILVLATVKGDVHDIGKNLVDIILSNNGYKVINLGIKCSIETMLNAYEEHKADAIGMSGLLVKSTLVMKENLEVIKNRNLKIPIVLGGAALTRRYVENDLKNIYDSVLVYATDAFGGLNFMEKLKNDGAESFAKTEIKKEVVALDEENLTGAEAKIFLAEKEEVHHSAIVLAEKIPVPPFWGSKVVEDISIDEVYRYINNAALIKGQWQVKKGKLSEEEYQKELKEKIYPEMNDLMIMAKFKKLLTPKVVYGYFPCQSEENDLIIYENDFKTEKLRFNFPRQKKDKYLCLSDYFMPVKSGKIDVVAFHLVTMGRRASEYSQKLFSENKYKDYLYFHGLSVESAEALAELWHKKIREELSIADGDAKEIKKLFSQGYKGARYSFGYPACPNLEDSAKLFKLLNPERIDVTLTEEFMMEPEQTTDAIIVHHPQARYFNI